MNNLQMALRLLDCTDWYLFQLQASGFPRELCGSECEQHRDDGPEAMEACSCLMCHSCYAATRDPDRLTEMWTQKPHGLLALRTGLESGVFVVDADRHGGADGLESLKSIKRRLPGALPRTISSLTGGGGRHLFYRHPGPDYVVRSSQSRLAPAVDVKGENNYVILPPSRKASKSSGYEWDYFFEPWNFGLADLDAKTASQVVIRRDDVAHTRVIDLGAEGFKESALIQVEQYRLDVLNAAKGRRNSTFFLLCCRLGEAVAGGAMTHAEATQLAQETGKAHFTYHETEKTSRSGIRTGLADALRGYATNGR